MQVIKDHKAYSTESKVRLIAGLVLALLTVYLLLPALVIPVFLAVDFLLRGFGFPKFSPLARLSEWLIKSLGLPLTPVYLPPKMFAAKIGLVFSAGIILLQLGGMNTIIVTCILGFFAFLESAFNICAGCYVYSWLQRLKWF